jgi:hypothetical protein
VIDTSFLWTAPHPSSRIIDGETKNVLTRVAIHTPVYEEFCFSVTVYTNPALQALGCASPQTKGKPWSQMELEGWLSTIFPPLR